VPRKEQQVVSARTSTGWSNTKLEAAPSHAYIPPDNNEVSKLVSSCIRQGQPEGAQCRASVKEDVCLIKLTKKGVVEFVLFASHPTSTYSIKQA